MAEVVRRGPPPGFGSDPINEQMRQAVQRDLAWEIVTRLRAAGWRLTLRDHGGAWTASFETKVCFGSTLEAAILAAVRAIEHG